MTFAIHPDYRLRKLKIGREEAPLIVVDNLVANADELVEQAATKVFGDVTSYYPGVRAKVSLAYQRFIIEQLRDVFAEVFGIPATGLHFTNCHFSLVTTPGDKLAILQRIPHVDSLFSTELAFIHYLFKADLGGTAFYRHRATGFEYVNLERNAEYCRLVSAELAGLDSPREGYIYGDTLHFERVCRQEGRFNRLLVYRRNSLHTGDLAKTFIPDLNPRTGRLSINGFLK